MNSIEYRVQLTCDAQPATGLGSGDTDSLVPRDANRRPYLPGSHIKGLMRASLKEIALQRADWKSNFERKPPVDRQNAWPYPFLDYVFGTSDSDAASYECNVRVDDATFVSDGTDEGDAFTHFVARTALETDGRAKATSLRTTETLRVGTQFAGTVHSPCDVESLVGMAWRLALVAVSAIGGSRSRSGQCIVELVDAEGQPTTPAIDVLLAQLTEKIAERTGDEHSLQQRNNTLRNTDPLAEQSTVIELIFAASTPVCFPEHPDRGNVITSGFSVPATAVQGTLLHLFNSLSSSFASQLFASPQFRCWPLNPCSHLTAEQLALESDADIQQQFMSLSRSIGVSLSHRAAKYSLEQVNESHFFEPAVVPLANVRDGLDAPIPLKASDGVLLFPVDASSNPKLWQSGMMPRHVTTHGVVDGPSSASDSGSRRNLYSVEAMMPMCWRGHVVVPNNVADQIVDTINSHREFRVGKGRSVRGRGRLVAGRVEDPTSMFTCQPNRLALVVQSPVLIPRSLHQQINTGAKSAEDVLRELATAWLSHHGLPRIRDSHGVWANAGLRFGWNRHADGGPFQGAAAVLQPGSIFTIEGNIESERLARAMMAGFHSDPGAPDPSKKFGMGCLAVHPGVAKSFYEPPTSSRRQGRHDSGRLNEAMKLVYAMRQTSHLPRPSQIRGIQRMINPNDEDTLHEARKHLRHQCERLAEIWHAWEPIADDVERLLKEFPADVASQALKSLADIATVHHDSRDEEL